MRPAVDAAVGPTRDRSEATRRNDDGGAKAAIVVPLPFHRNGGFSRTR